jgi:hypothetical protein
MQWLAILFMGPCIEILQETIFFLFLPVRTAILHCGFGDAAVFNYGKV